MTDILRTAIVYIAYLIDPHAYPGGSVLPRLIACTAAVQCVLALLLAVRSLRNSALFAGLALVSAAAVPAGLAWAGARGASMLTSEPVWFFCALQFAVALYWFAARHTRFFAHAAFFILFAVPCVSLLVAAHLVDPSYRTY